MDIEKQIEEVMRLVGRYGNLNYQECDADYREHQTKADVYAQDQKETFAQIEEKLRTLLSSAQSGERAADTERHLAIGKAIERACIDMPEGTELLIELEKDAGTVTMIDRDGNEHQNFDHEGGFAGVVNGAIDAAIAASQPNGEV